MNVTFHGIEKPLVPVLIGIPTLGRVRMEWVIGMLTAGLPINTVGTTVPIYNRTVAEARNVLADMAIRGGYKYLVFIDDDTIPTPNTIRRLIWNVENNPHFSVVAGIYPVKDDPAAPLIFDAPGCGPSFNWKVGDVRKVWAVGMGATIIRVSDLVDAKAKFDTVKVRDYPAYGSLTEVVEYFRSASEFVPDPNTQGGGWNLTMTEDLFFCDRMGKAGKEVWADCGVVNSHIGTDGRIFDISMCRPFADPAQGLEKIYLDLGSGSVYRKWIDGTRVLRVDADPEVHPDYAQDVRKLNIKDGFADGVILSHVVEHFTRFEAETVLDEAVRVLKEGGFISISCPDFAAILDLYKQGEMSEVLRALYGGQDHQYQYHYTVWDFDTLCAAMARRGCAWVSKTFSAREPYSMQVWFYKGDPQKAEEIRCQQANTPTPADPSSSDTLTKDNSSSETTVPSPQMLLSSSEENTEPIGSAPTPSTCSGPEPSA